MCSSDLYEKRAALGIFTAEERAAAVASGSYDAPSAPAIEGVPGDVAEVVADAAATPAVVHSTAELLEALTGTASDAPLCFTCGTKMRPAGSCYICEGCGATSGCS